MPHAEDVNGCFGHSVLCGPGIPAGLSGGADILVCRLIKSARRTGMSRTRRLEAGRNACPTNSKRVTARPVQVLPAVALFHDRLEILLPDDAILNRVFDHCA